ncbi:probable cinnamyl alcohol dehydrogenase 1 [Carya illinoinensis]|uniref:probable cinnamyl alcohol dehydrogenase 1 n=1 Tax=Carya illinoinensis TaxID=32201 RepID=UPI001C7278C3|nr:probable cinnamyl alcohol dehydrogenase 1 [Carya illinoinensis]
MSILVLEYRYCFSILDDYPLTLAAPLLYAGITVYAPMVCHKMNQPGKSLGVIGLGGLGHMEVKFGKVLALAKSLDFIVDTASGDHPFDPYMSQLKIGGVLALAGFPGEVKFSPANLNIGMRTVSGSIAVGTKVTQEMIDFCATRKVYPMIEVIPIEYANKAIERVLKRDVKYRFMIDIEKSLK